MKNVEVALGVATLGATVGVLYRMVTGFPVAYKHRKGKVRKLPLSSIYFLCYF
jgi:hypothetical protein